MARFLNKISFHYIPAVRGRDIFSHFLSLLHDALLDDEKAGLLRSTEELMNTLNESTSEMSIKIRDGVGVESNVQPPTNLRVLFNALDFATGYDDHSIPLQKRGDGVQSRHIPFILDFIARHTQTHHIWAYEEPETSLELGPAFELAKQFKDEFCEENQIFITTHSPAFYDLKGDNVSKWLVHQKSLDSGRETKVEKITSEELIDGKLGVAALIADRAKQAYENIERLKESVKRLDAELSEHNTPHIIVEGITDKIIMEAAYRKLYPNRDPNFHIVHAEGANNIPPYIKSARILSKKLSHAVIGLFDRDQEGRKQIREFSDHVTIEDTSFLEVCSERHLYVGLLPLPQNLVDVERVINERMGGEISLPIPIEFMFPDQVINDALDQNILVLEDRISKANDPELPTQINLTELYSNHLPGEFVYLAKKVRKNTKREFANWVIDQDDEFFNNFHNLFEQLERVIEKDREN